MQLTAACIAAPYRTFSINLHYNVTGLDKIVRGLELKKSVGTREKEGDVEHFRDANLKYCKVST